jgi:tyrosyl-tRNA synthetase
MPILVGTDGVRKMSKSYDNYVGVEQDPAEMFGRLMSIPDDVMPDYYLLLLGRELDAGAHPNEAKRALARELIAQFHDAEAAAAAEARFDSIHRRGEAPEDMPTVSVDEGETVHLPALLAESFGISSSEARRLMGQGGVRLDGEVLAGDGLDVPGEDLRGRVLQLGKRRFVRIA